MITHHSSLQEFSSRVEPYFYKKEALYNLPLGILNRYAANSDQSNITFFTYEKNHKLICSFLRTAPHPYIITFHQEVSWEIIEEICLELLHKKILISDIVGTREDILRFSKKWTQLTSNTFEIRMEQLVYKLEKVNIIPVTGGDLEVASASYEQLASEWLYRFGLEAFVQMSKEEAMKLAKRLILDKTLYFWTINGNPVSMANQSRSTKNGITINGVYTPDENKRKGYATSLVSALSQKFLSKGYSFCSLYTDRNNPTSNKIYERIGYTRVGESVMVKIEK